jgi:hypothetical protein
VLRDAVALGEEARVVVRLILPALHVNVGLEHVDQLDGRRVRVDVDEVDAFERRDAGGAEVFWDERSSRSLVDLRISGERDDQHVALAACELEVLNVAGVNDVEAPVAMHDRLAVACGGFAQGEQLLERADFLRRGHRRSGNPDRGGDIPVPST